MTTKSKYHPPRLALWLLSIMGNQGNHSAIIGDLEEEFAWQVETRGLAFARFYHWILVLISLPSFICNHIYWSVTMFRNYLKTAWRSIGKNWGFSSINIIGLSVGMACTLMAMYWVNFLMSYDTYHTHADRIHQVFVTAHLENNTVSFETAFAPLGQDLKDRYPEIESFVRLLQPEEVVLKSNDHFFVETQGCIADASLFDIFSFEFIEGSPENALTRPDHMVVTREIARKYFGDEEAVGQTLTVNNQYDMTIAAVVENIPSNSHMEYTFFLPMDFARELGYNLDEYQTSEFNNYLLLHENVDAHQLSEKIRQEFEAPIDELSFKAEFYLVPLTQIVFKGSQGIIQFLLILLAVMAFLTLFTACINFMNLSTARSLNRAKEVGMRKVVGGHRFQLIAQFLSESLMQTVLAAFLALIIVATLLPTTQNLLDIRASVSLLDGPFLWGLLVVVLVTGLFAGSYPALAMSSYQPVKALSGSVKKGKKAASFRKILVVVQFFFSILLITCTLVAILQFRHLENAWLGFETRNILCMRGDKWGDMEAIRHELLALPEVEQATTSSDYPSMVDSFTPSWGLTQEMNGVLTAKSTVGYDYLDLFGMELVAGRFFSRAITSDESESIIVNEHAVKELGLESPVGQQIYFHDKLRTIVGVVKNTYNFPLKFGVGPLVLTLRPRTDDFLFIKIREGSANTVRPAIEKLMKRFNPGYPVDLTFYEDFSIDEDNLLPAVNRIMSFLALVGIFISCLGLYGLASFMSQQRTKEIGIRKTLGGSISRMVGMLTGDYIKLLLLANALALPVAYLAVSAILDFFAYRIHLSLAFFLVTGAVVMLFALMSVISQTLKAALIRPVQSLRYE